MFSSSVAILSLESVWLSEDRLRKSQTDSARSELTPTAAPNRSTDLNSSACFARLLFGFPQSYIQKRQSDEDERDPTARKDYVSAATYMPGTAMAITSSSAVAAQLQVRRPPVHAPCSLRQAVAALVPRFAMRANARCMTLDLQNRASGVLNKRANPAPGKAAWDRNRIVQWYNRIVFVLR